jgi:hypothetical protein
MFKGVQCERDSGSCDISITNNDFSYNVMQDPEYIGNCIAFGSGTQNIIDYSGGAGISNNIFHHLYDGGISCSHSSYLTIENNIFHTVLDETRDLTFGVRLGAQNQHSQIVRYNTYLQYPRPRCIMGRRSWYWYEICK